MQFAKKASFSFDILRVKAYDCRRDSYSFNSLTIKKQTTKFSSANFLKNVKSSLYYIERADSVDLDEVAHNEPPHQDLLCLQIQLFSSLVLK